MADNKLISANINEEEGIAWLTLNRPEKKNALSIALLNELVSLLESIRDNEKIRCIVTRGARRFLFFRARLVRYAQPEQSQPEPGRWRGRRDRLHHAQTPSGNGGGGQRLVSGRRTRNDQRS